jgi:hypothetical protein
MTLAEFLDLPEHRKEYLVRFDLIRRFDDVAVSLYISSGGFISSSTDPDPNRPYPGRLKQPHKWSMTIPDPRITGGNVGSVRSPFIILNDDGALDDWLSEYSWNGGQMTLRGVEKGKSHASGIILGATRVSGQPTMDGKGTITVQTQDLRARLGRSCQQSKFEGFGTALRLGGQATNSAATCQNPLAGNISDTTIAYMTEFRIRQWESNGTGDRFVMGKEGSWFFWTNSSKALRFRYYEPDGTGWVDWEYSGVVVDSIVWRHITLRLPAGFDPDTDNPVLLLDGDTVAHSATNTGAGGFVCDNGLQLGGSITSFDRNGWDIDEVRWMAGEKDIELVSCDAFNPVYANDDMLSLYWRFDEGFGTNAFPEAADGSLMDSWPASRPEGYDIRDKRQRMPPSEQRRDQMGFLFDGTDDIVTVTSHADFDFDDGNGITFDLCFCIRDLPSTRAENAALIFKSQAWYLRILSASDKLELGIWDGVSAYVTALFDRVFKCGHCYHIVVEYDETDAILRMPPESEDPIQTVSAVSASLQRLDGMICSPRLWKNTGISLSDPNGRASRFVETANHANGTDLVAEWRFQDTTGTNVVDALGTHDGTFSGGAAVPQKSMRFALGANVEWVGTGTGGEELAGREKPQCWGQVPMFPVVLVDGVDDAANVELARNYGIYAYHHREVDGIRALYDGGKRLQDDGNVTDLWGTTVASGSFKTAHELGLLKVGDVPTGELLAWVRGDNAEGTEFLQTPSDIAVELARSQGGIGNRIGAGVADLLTADRPVKAHFFTKENAPIVAAAMDFLMAGQRAFWYSNRFNILDMAAIPDEPWTADYTITDDDIAEDGVKWLGSNPVSWKETVRFGRYGATIPEDETVSLDAKERMVIENEWRYVRKCNASILDRELDADEHVVDTALSNEWDAVNELNRLWTFFSVPRKRIFVTLMPGRPKSMWFSAIAGEIVNVTTDRFQIQGDDFLISKITEDASTDVMTLELWGSVIIPTEPEVLGLPPNEALPDWDLGHWFEVDDPDAEVTYGTGDNIATLVNRGNLGNATQSTESRRPDFKESIFGVHGGILFDTLSARMFLDPASNHSFNCDLHTGIYINAYKRFPANVNHLWYDSSDSSETRGVTVATTGLVRAEYNNDGFKDLAEGYSLSDADSEELIVSVVLRARDSGVRRAACFVAHKGNNWVLTDYTLATPNTIPFQTVVLSDNLGYNQALSAKFYLAARISMTSDGAAVDNDDVFGYWDAAHIPPAIQHMVDNLISKYK